MTKKNRPIILIIFSLVFLSPWILNSAWYLGGPKFLYYLARFSCSSNIILFGVVIIFFSKQLSIFSTGDERQYQTLSARDHVFKVLIGLVITAIGIISQWGTVQLIYSGYIPP